MMITRIFRALIGFSLLFCLAVPYGSAGAVEGVTLPYFSDFVTNVADGQANVVRGVFVPGVLALAVVQQPDADPGSVSIKAGVATQFSEAARNHVIGLLAHNYLAGAAFTSLKVGREVRIIYGDGRVDYFLVNRLAKFQAPQPNDSAGNLIDLSTDIPYSTQDVFTMFYDGDTHVTFQTCIKQDDNSSWGRLFVTAIPVPQRNFRSFIQFLLLHNWNLIR
jgi:hypothetical protein